MRQQPISLKRSVFIRLLALTVAVVLLFYAIGLYLNSTAISNVRDGLQVSLDTEAQYIAGELERELNNLLVFQQELASDDYLMRYYITHPTLSAYKRIEYIKQISNQLWRITRFSSIVETARVHFRQLDKTIAADKAFYDTLDESAWARFSVYTGATPFHVEKWNNRVYLLYSKIERKEPAFIIEIGISPEKLLARLSSMRSSDGIAMLLVHEDGRPFAGTPEANALTGRLKRVGQKYLVDEAEYLVSAAEIPSLSMRMLCCAPVNTAMKPLLQHNLWVWGLTLLAGILLVAYLLYYRLYILHPLNTIFESARRAEETGRFLIEQRNTDFDDIYAQFTTMVERLERMAGRAYEEQLRAQRAELQQLQMQINPHFFYNTLFMVYRMAQNEGCEDIAQVCLNLSNYYRYITKMPGHDVPLRDEVDHIRQYLDIQRIRFSPRITIHMDDLPQDIENEKIPPLMLQPIVENAFVHGVKNRTSGGYVEMHYQYTDTWYRVIVYDNGGNMDEAAVEELNRRLKCGDLEAGSALQNLARRMELRYGDKYDLKLESYHHGLRVSITFPRQEGSDHDVIAGG